MSDSVNVHNSEKVKFFIENVARFCDKCGREYETADVEILQQTNVSAIIHFGCPRCKSRHLATFVKPMGIASRVPVNTDLGVEELARFAGKRGVSSNDVLDVHEFFKDGSVTVEDMLKMPSP